MRVVESQTNKENIRGQKQEERAASVEDRIEPVETSKTVKIIVGKPKMESIREQGQEEVSQTAEDSKTVKVVVDKTKATSVRGQEQETPTVPTVPIESLPEAKSEEEAGEGAPAARGQRQEPEGDAEGDALRAHLLAEEAEAAAEAGKEVVHSLEQAQEEMSRGGAKESGEPPASNRAEVEEIRAQREASLTHAQLREENKEGEHKEHTPPKGVPASRSVYESEEEHETADAAPAHPPKKVTSTKSSSTKTKTNAKSKPKEFKPSKVVSPEAAKLAASKAAVALVDPVDLVDIDNMTPVEVADGGNHQDNTLGPQLGVGVIANPVVIDCSGSMDPFPGQPVETYEPPVNADLKDKMVWGDAVRDMLARIRQMKMGGDPLRKAIREEVNTLVVLRAKLFCAAAAAAAPVAFPKSESHSESEGAVESRQQSKEGS